MKETETTVEMTQAEYEKLATQGLEAIEQGRQISDGEAYALQALCQGIIKAICDSGHRVAIALPSDYKPRITALAPGSDSDQ